MKLNQYESEENFLASLRRGDSTSFEQLYQECRPMILNFVRLNNGRNDDGIDLLQDAMIVLLKNLQRPGFELSCKVKVFIYSVCRKKWLNQLRQKKYTIVDVNDFVDNLPDFDEDEKVDIDISKALERLDETCRKLLTYFYLYEKSLEEIAHTLQLENANVAKVRRFRCMQRLKEIAKGLHT